MKADWIKNISAATYAVLLHIVLIALFVVGIGPSAAPKLASQPKVDIVQATVMNEADIIKEMQRQQEIEDQKRLKEQQQQEKIDKKLAETQKELVRKEQEFLEQQERAKLEKKKQQEKIKKLEQERLQQEKKALEAAKQRQEEEEKQRVAELERKKAEQKRQAEEQRKLEAEKARKAEEEKKRQAEQARKEEEARKLKAEQERKAEEAKKKKAEQERKAEEKRKREAELKAQIAEADRLLQESLQSEQQEQEQRRVAGVVDQYSLMIKQRIKRYWIKPASSTQGMQATLRVSLLPGGDVKRVSVIESSGNALFDRSAESAVYKAAPLPQPTDPKAAAALRDFQFIFKPE